MAKSNVIDMLSGDKAHKQYAALPYTVRNGDVSILLVTSRETRRWIIPKGWSKKTLAPCQVAALEAFEEAGLLGEVASEPCTSFTYWKQISEKKKKYCEVDVFMFCVLGEAETWPEMFERKRSWMSLEDASLCISDPDLSTFLRGLSPGDFM
ncbi:NUDIX domain protein [mine drainage metagenome]|uniref:NUDIX domain protein n=1 Tax=mine drainage metagenome TaxID=410659 RepID=A0A1J5RF14_9ZZZZ